MIISVVTDDELYLHRLSELVDWDKLILLRLKRAKKLGELKMLLETEGFCR